MNCRILAVMVLLQLISLAFGQDVVRLHKGDSLTVKVTEIGESQIQYKRLDNLEGPVYTIKKSDVESITYSNGNTDRFVLVSETKDSKALVYHVLDTMMVSICSKPEALSEKIFTINYGENVFKGHNISVSGICKSGLLGRKLMKHGQFNFFDGDKLVMKTKYVKDSEVKTDCVFDEKHRRNTSKACFDSYFSR